MPRGFRYALIVTAMAFTGIAGHAGPLQAAPQTEAAASSAKPLALGKFTRHHKKHVRHPARSSRKHQAAAKASSKTSSKAGKDDDVRNDKKTAATGADEQLSPAVANARAELASPPSEQPLAAQNIVSDSSTLTESDKAATAEPLANGVQVTTSDQLNDMDRDALNRDADANRASETEPATLALAQVVQPAAAANDGSGWGGASLIGKIFIAFGVMLTLASAARMIVA